MERRIIVYDTILRDGSQGVGISFSVEDKLGIVGELDKLRVDYVEGGYPSSNPKDAEFFKRAKNLDLRYAKLAAFGSTCKKNTKPEDDYGLRSLIEASTPVVTIFGKSSESHVKKALQTSLEENLRMISSSVAYLKGHNKEVIYDAEHFFDGFKENSGYAIATLQAAKDSGADWIVLCDTKGGTDFDDVREIIRKTKSGLPNLRYGIHTHDDCDYGTANALTAIKEGFEMVQGTINGYGERIGNGNLITIIVNAETAGYKTRGDIDSSKLTHLYRLLCDIANLPYNPKQHFVGPDAFAHKGGAHVSAVLKDPRLYEHIPPELVGNQRRFYASEMGGTSTIEAMLGIDRKSPLAKRLVEEVKKKEGTGYSYEAAQGSLELLKRNLSGQHTKIFDKAARRIEDIVEENGKKICHATVKIWVNGDTSEETTTGNGPVHALDLALRKLLTGEYPELKALELTDYRVRVISDGTGGTASKVRVIIDSKIGEKTFGTVGVGQDIIDASFEALVESYEFAHLQVKENRK